MKYEEKDIVSWFEDCGHSLRTASEAFNETYTPDGIRKRLIEAKKGLDIRVYSYKGVPKWITTVKHKEVCEGYREPRLKGS